MSISAKTIKKRLMRGRGRYLFGRRAWLTLRVDAAVFPVAYPKFPFSGRLAEEDWEGFYVGDEGELDVGVIFGGKEPTGEHIYRKTREGTGSLWCWWEIRYTNCQPFLSPEEEEQLVEYSVARKEWERVWLHGDNDHALLQGLYATQWHTKTYDLKFVGDSVLITFAVKWFYPQRKYGFCRELSRWTKALDRAGATYRLVKQ